MTRFTEAELKLDDSNDTNLNSHAQCSFVNWDDRKSFS